jgi:iron(III) transport system ATP-binding protein
MLLEVKQIEKSFEKDVPVVQKASFDVKENEIVALLGPSGCGKTTTLRMISGFEHTDAGEIYLDGVLLSSSRVHLQPQKRGIGFVFQDYALFPHMSALDNVAFGLDKPAQIQENCFCRGSFVPNRNG